jgi:hypothetical protein
MGKSSSDWVYSYSAVAALKHLLANGVSFSSVAGTMPSGIFAYVFDFLDVIDRRVAPVCTDMVQRPNAMLHNSALRFRPHLFLPPAGGFFRPVQTHRNGQQALPPFTFSPTVNTNMRLYCAPLMRRRCDEFAVTQDLTIENGQWIEKSRTGCRRFKK